MTTIERLERLLKAMAKADLRIAGEFSNPRTACILSAEAAAYYDVLDIIQSPERLSLLESAFNLPPVS